MRKKSTNAASINTKCVKKLTNIFMHERKQRITFKDENTIEFLYAVR